MRYAKATALYLRQWFDPRASQAVSTRQILTDCSGSQAEVQFTRVNSRCKTPSSLSIINFRFRVLLPPGVMPGLLESVGRRVTVQGTVQSDGENPHVGTTPNAASSLCGAIGRPRPKPAAQWVVVAMRISSTLAPSATDFSILYMRPSASPLRRAS